MTPTIKTLTAIAALSLATGGAMAQDTQTVPLAQPDAAAVAAPESGTTFVLNPDGSRQVLTAEETAADEATEAEPAADAEAPAEEATEAAEEPAAEDAATGEAEATEPEAAEPAAAADEDTEEADAAEAEEPAAEEATDEAEEATDEGEEAGAADEGEEAAEGEEAEAHAAADSHGAGHIVDVAFSFEGPFGTYDQHQLQRGLQVYTEVCAACHGLRYVPIRTLGDATGPGLPEDQVRAFAAEFTKVDPETGDDVPREPADHFPEVPHVEGMGPDLSLMAKARAGFHGPFGTGINQLFNGIGGPEYIYSILVGYTGETKEEAGTTFYENTAFPGGWIAMPPPLFDESLDFEDGHPNDLHSLSKEVSGFLMWTAEPKMMQRKQMGFVSVIFLMVLTILLYLTNKKLWAPHKHPRKED